MLESPFEAIARCMREVCRSTSLRKAKAKGKTVVAGCRHRDDRDPSLYVYTTILSDGIGHWVYKCHSCGAHGMLVNLIAEDTGLSTYEVDRVLRDYLGEEATSLQITGKRVDASRDPRVLDLVAEYCHSIAWSGNAFYTRQMAVQRDYLESRASLRQIRQLGLGVAPNRLVREQSLASFLERKGHARLLEDATHILERMACRVVIPVRDESGHVVSLCSRSITGADKNRYINEGAKGQVLVGMDVARDAIRRDGLAVVVEGPFDMSTVRELGSLCLDRVLENGKDAISCLGNVVACMGSRPTRDQMILLKKHTDTFIMVRDGDRADDIRGAQAIISDAAAVGLRASVVSVPDQMDPDEYIRHLLDDGLPPKGALQVFYDNVLHSPHIISVNVPVAEAIEERNSAASDASPVNLYELYSQADNRPHITIGRQELAQVLTQCDHTEILVWLTLKARACIRKASDGRFTISGDSIARTCERTWRQVRTVMESLRTKGLIAWGKMSEKAEFEVRIVVSKESRLSHIRVPLDFIWQGHAVEAGSALPTLLALKSAAMGKDPITNIRLERIATRVGRSDRAVKDDIKRLVQLRHVKEHHDSRCTVRLVSLIPV